MLILWDHNKYFAIHRINNVKTGGRPATGDVHKNASDAPIETIAGEIALSAKITRGQFNKETTSVDFYNCRVRM